MSGLWSAQQHEWLSALGHTLYVQGSAEAPVAVALPAADKPVVSRPPRPSAAPPAPRRPEAPSPPTRIAEAPRRAGSRLPDRLHFALIRASGCNPNADDAAEIMSGWPPSSELRGNPAAKRALWPQLRALRRQRAP